MLHKTGIRAFLFASAATAAGLLPLHHVRAAAFQIHEDSAQDLGSSYAGSGSEATGAETARNNPAGMTQLQGVRVSLGGSLIAPQLTFHGGAVNAFGQPISGRDNVDGGEAAFVPYGHVTYHPEGSQFAFGLSVTTPFGLVTDYPSDFVGRYQASKTDLRTIDINPSVAYQVTPWLSLGAGVSAQWARASLSSYINSSSIATAQFRRLTVLPDGVFDLNGDDWAFGYNFGALIQPGPQTHIGITYRSRVQHDFSGPAVYSVPFPLSLSPQFAPQTGKTKIVLPDTIGLSITQGIGPRLKVSADLNWTNWSQFKNLNIYNTSNNQLAAITENYHNSLFAAVGASYQLTPDLALRGGTAFDQTPVTNPYRTARVPDGDRYWISIGASYNILPSVTVDAGYAHAFVQSVRIGETSPTGDVLRGKYQDSLDIFSLGTRLAF